MTSSRKKALRPPWLRPELVPPWERTNAASLTPPWICMKTLAELGAEAKLLRDGPATQKAYAKKTPTARQSSTAAQRPGDLPQDLQDHIAEARLLGVPIDEVSQTRLARHTHTTRAEVR